MSVAVGSGSDDEAVCMVTYGGGRARLKDNSAKIIQFNDTFKHSSCCNAQGGPKVLTI